MVMMDSSPVILPFCGTKVTLRRNVVVKKVRCWRVLAVGR